MSVPVPLVLGTRVGPCHEPFGPRAAARWRVGGDHPDVDRLPRPRPVVQDAEHGQAPAARWEWAGVHLGGGGGVCAAGGECGGGPVLEWHHKGGLPPGQAARRRVSHHFIGS